MQFSTWLKNKGLDPVALRGPLSPVQFHAQADGTINITAWTLDNVAEPSADDLKSILAAPEPADAGTIKAICQAYVYGYADPNTQMNATAMIASGEASADQVAAYKAARDWINACRAQCSRLIEGNDTAYDRQAASYPAPDDAVVAFLKAI